MLPLAQFQTPGTIVTGGGSSTRVTDFCPQGSAVVIVSDPGVARAGIVDQIAAHLSPMASSVTTFAEVEPDPSVETVQRVTELILSKGANVVLGLGGGSSMDTAKVAAAVADSGDTVRDWRGRTLPRRTRRLIQIPTTSGTGSEATDRGILSDGEMKVGYLSPVLIADVVILDPTLTLSVPPAITATTGMDALTHAIEAFTAPGATPLTDVLALGAITRIGRHLRTAVLRGSDETARTEMAIASLWAGIAFNNAGLGLVHALALPVGARFHVPHGLACAVLLAPVMAFNYPAHVEKFGQIAAALGEGVQGCSPVEAASTSVEAVKRLRDDIGVQAGFRGIPGGAVGQLAEEAFAIKRLVNSNPRTVSLADCSAVLLSALSE